jgi:hypothetical protein
MCIVATDGNAGAKILARGARAGQIADGAGPQVFQRTESRHLSSCRIATLD